MKRNETKLYLNISVPVLGSQEKSYRCHNVLKRDGVKQHILSNANSLFTTPTRTRQNCLVLSCPCRRCKHTWRQDKTVLSQSQMYWGLLKTWKLETGSVLSCLRLCSQRRHGQDKTVLSCPCRRCEQAIRDHFIVHSIVHYVSKRSHL